MHTNENTWERSYFRLWRYLRKDHPGVLDEYIRYHSARWRKLPLITDKPKGESKEWMKRFYHIGIVRDAESLFCTPNREIMIIANHAGFIIQIKIVREKPKNDLCSRQYCGASCDANIVPNRGMDWDQEGREMKDETKEMLLWLGVLNPIFIIAFFIGLFLGSSKP